MENNKPHKKKPNTSPRHGQANANTASNSTKGKGKISATPARNPNRTSVPVNSSAGHAYSSVQNPDDRPSYTVEQLKNADVSDIPLGNVVGISGMDASAFKRLGIKPTIDDMIKLHRENMKTNKESGKAFSVKQGESLRGKAVKVQKGERHKSERQVNFYAATGSLAYNPYEEDEEETR
ncbi:hypothetical protein BDQ17DRAFT_1432267 [Cyathus striatus]|nr:hypothetical protein BDQ17DRAFT_1432267 [Cyathus striatus]